MDAFIQAVTENPVGLVVSFIIAIVLLIAFIGVTIKLIVAIVKKIKEGKWSEIPDLIKDYMSQAEALIGASGQTKKEVVMAKIRTYCAENNLQFDEDKVSTIIEEDIDLTKTVNARDKDIEATSEEGDDNELNQINQETIQEIE